MNIKIKLNKMQAMDTLEVLREASRWMDTDHTKRIVESASEKVWNVIKENRNNHSALTVSVTQTEAEVMRDIMDNTLWVPADVVFHPIVKAITDAMTPNLKLTNEQANLSLDTFLIAHQRFATFTTAKLVETFTTALDSVVLEDVEVVMSKDDLWSMKLILEQYESDGCEGKNDHFADSERLVGLGVVIALIKDAIEERAEVASEERRSEGSEVTGQQVVFDKWIEMAASFTELDLTTEEAKRLGKQCYDSGYSNVEFVEELEDR